MADPREPPMRRTDAPPFEVVVLEPDDWQRLRAIRLDALVESPDSFASTSAREAAFDEGTWRERLQGALWAIVDVDGVDVALACGYLPGELPVEAELVSLWVRPEYRGLGYGGHLVETVAMWAVTAGCQAISASVVDGNEQAQVLYDNHLFVATGETTPLPHKPELTEIRLRREL